MTTKQTTPFAANYRQTDSILDNINEYRRNKPTKNATKPNPFKIILLQPTRKENNRETEEMMERATVTLETERAK
jgi:hypothetical protein